MTEYKKPIPKPTPWSKPFWDGCKKHELLIQRCKDCQKPNFYPKLFCPHCLSHNLEWIKASGQGKIYSYTVVYSYAPTQFSGDTPYVVAIIDLEEGVRMMSNIVQCPPEKVKCNMKVQVAFDDLTKELTLPRFKPVA
jgi:uncharacterized OB-fold protein